MTFKRLKDLTGSLMTVFAYAASIMIFELQRRGLLNETYHSFCDRIAANAQKKREPQGAWRTSRRRDPQDAIMRDAA